MMKWWNDCCNWVGVIVGSVGDCLTVVDVCAALDLQSQTA